MTNHAAAPSHPLAHSAAAPSHPLAHSAAGHPEALPAEPVPAGAGGKRAAVALALSLITLAFWTELILEGERTGFLGSLRRLLLGMTSGAPEALQIVVSAGAPVAALTLALLSLRDARNRRVALAALVASAVLAALVVAAALSGDAR